MNGTWTEGLQTFAGRAIHLWISGTSRPWPLTRWVTRWTWATTTSIESRSCGKQATIISRLERSVQPTTKLCVSPKCTRLANDGHRRMEMTIRHSSGVVRTAMLATLVAVAVSTPSACASTALPRLEDGLRQPDWKLAVVFRRDKGERVYLGTASRAQVAMPDTTAPDQTPKRRPGARGPGADYE